jgi:cysteinyl-tRNA synthetase
LRSSMPLAIYNTLTRSKEPFQPQDPQRVTIYVCGPTVYDSPHIGHAKSYIAFDIVVRYLRHRGYDVLYVQNITDVGHLTDDADEGEDKIAKRAAQRRVEPMQLVETYTREYFAAMDQLNVLRPDISPRASGHIPEMLDLIRRLLEEGHAYEADGNVYFDVASYPEYGKLSGRSLEEQETSGRVAPGEGKRDPADFALWKRAEAGHIMRWPSPWGVGYPGWHIECSAMSMKYLGETLDIHGAGVDNLFPHNEDEIAQSEAATQRPFVRTWMHNGTVLVGGEKMSKSKGNFTTIGEAIERYGANLLRFYILNSHYRSPTDYSETTMGDAARAWERIRTADQNVERALGLPAAAGDDTGAAALRERTEALREGLLAAMDDDFNTPAALARVFELTTELNRFIAERPAGLAPAGREALESARQAMRDWLDLLGLRLEAPAATDDLSPQLVDLLLELRQNARQAKDFAAADRIRQRLGEIGVIVEDRPSRQVAPSGRS